MQRLSNVGIVFGEKRRTVISSYNYRKGKKRKEKTRKDKKRQEKKRKDKKRKEKKRKDASRIKK